MVKQDSLVVGRSTKGEWKCATLAPNGALCATNSGPMHTLKSCAVLLAIATRKVWASVLYMGTVSHCSSQMQCMWGIYSFIIGSYQTSHTYDNTDVQPRTTPTAVDYIKCLGSEHSLGDCVHFSHSFSNCSHEHSVGVRCQPGGWSNHQLQLILPTHWNACLVPCCVFDAE